MTKQDKLPIVITTSIAVLGVFWAIASFILNLQMAQASTENRVNKLEVESLESSKSVQTIEKKIIEIETHQRHQKDSLDNITRILERRQQ